jgi:hypothetical protein
MCASDFPAHKHHECFRRVFVWHLYKVNQAPDPDQTVVQASANGVWRREPRFPTPTSPLMHPAGPRMEAPKSHGYQALETPHVMRQKRRSRTDVRLSSRGRRPPLPSLRRGKAWNRLVRAWSVVDRILRLSFQRVIDRDEQRGERGCEVEAKTPYFPGNSVSRSVSLPTLFRGYIIDD